MEAGFDGPGRAADGPDPVRPATDRSEVSVTAFSDDARGPRDRRDPGRAGRLAMPGLAVLAGTLYLVGLTVSGYANTYYAMAAQAASQSWSAWFFGALDASGFITLDKPPLATMLMGLSVRLLGLDSWSILLPQALLGVATVLVLASAVGRSFGRRAGLLAGLLMALTPVSVLIFRYDNPDALLVFLLVSAAWALARGLEHGRVRWAVAAAALVGLAFTTKYLQAWIVLPGFALTWLLAAPGTVRRRLAGLAAAGLATIAASGWWVLVVELIPAGSRPYIGGSGTDSALALILGYDGLGRIFGNRPAGSGLGSALDGLVGGTTAGRGGPTFGGEPGLLRMLNDQFGGQVGWLVPVSVVAAGVLIVLAWRRSRAPALGRTDPMVGGTLLWVGWLAIHLVVFSFMSGIIHAYYTVALAPAVAAVTAAVADRLWVRRAHGSAWAGPVLAGGAILTGLVAIAILDRTPSFAPGLGIGVVAMAAAAGVVLAIPAVHLDPRAGRAAAVVALVAVLAGPLAYDVTTMATAHSGGDPAAGPSQGDFGPGGGVPGGTVDAALATFLVEHRGDARWIVAVTGAGSAAAIQLAAGEPVMTMGGFSGADAAPTVDQLAADVAAGELRYVIAEGAAFGGRPGSPGPGGGPGGGTAGLERTAWLEAHCTVVAVPGSTVSVYDCAPAG
jgi:4-amino-4-deoxy-L-arabinose transferase-like glycosyltransferase